MRDVKGNGKGFYKYICSKTGGNVGMPLNSVMEKAEELTDFLAGTTGISGNSVKCKILHLRTISPMYQCRLGGIQQLKSSLAEKACWLGRIGGQVDYKREICP